MLCFVTKNDSAHDQRTTIKPMFITEYSYNVTNSRYTLVILDLEKNPLVEPVQYRPVQGSDLNKLAQDANEMFEKVMHRLADRVRQRRIQMFPLFEDYDRIHNGTVSRSQFRRVLSELDLGSMVSSREFTVLYRKFDVLIGGKHDFNYIAFCDLVNEYALFEHGKP